MSRYEYTISSVTHLVQYNECLTLQNLIANLIFMYSAMGAYMHGNISN